MPLDPRLAAALAVLNAEPVNRSGTAAERRAEILRRREARGLTLDAAEVTTVSKVWDASADGVPVRLYRNSEGLLPAVVYLHGGGWWLGDLDDSDPGCRRKALSLDAVIISVDYRLAPENPFPAGLDDCWTATKWVFEHAEELGIDPSRIAVNGGSAGANLAAAVTLMARDAGGPTFCAQLLEVPGMDLRFEGGSVDEFPVGYVLDKVDLHECSAWYCGDVDPAHPLISPVNAKVHDLPPAMVMTSEYDPVRDSGEVYAQMLVDAGVPTVLKRWDGLAHGCGEMDALIPEIAEAYRGTYVPWLRSFLHP